MNDHAQAYEDAYQMGYLAGFTEALRNHDASPNRATLFIVGLLAGLLLGAATALAFVQ